MAARQISANTAVQHPWNIPIASTFQAIQQSSFETICPVAIEELVAVALVEGFMAYPLMSPSIDITRAVQAEATLVDHQ